MSARTRRSCSADYLYVFLSSASSCLGITTIALTIASAGVIISDMILVFAPIKLIWAVRLPLITKIRLVSVFASTLITTAVSLYYIWALLKVGGLTEEWAATIHVCSCSSETRRLGGWSFCCNRMVYGYLLQTLLLLSATSSVFLASPRAMRTTLRTRTHRQFTIPSRATLAQRWTQIHSSSLPLSLVRDSLSV